MDFEHRGITNLRDVGIYQVILSGILEDLNHYHQCSETVTYCFTKDCFLCLFTFCTRITSRANL